jgi:hemoglobin
MALPPRSNSPLPATASVFDRIGGRDVLRQVVDAFYQRVLQDMRLRPFFDHTDLDDLRAHQTAFLAAALGGPQQYSGRGLRSAHAGRGIQAHHFAAVAGHLQTALQDAGVPRADVNAILGTVAGVARDVIDV